MVRVPWLRALAFAVLSATLVGTLWVIPYLPTNDGPESILAVHMGNHFGDPGVIYPEVFAPATQFGGRGFTVLFEPLEEWLGWQRGLQVALSIIVLIEAWAVVALVRAVDPRRLPLAFLGFPLALSWSLYMGLFAFTLASGVGLFALALSLDPSPMTPSRRARLAALLLLVAFFHVFAAALMGTMIAVTSVARAPRKGRLGELLKVGLTGLPAAALLGATVLVGQKGTAATAFQGHYVFPPLREALGVWPRTIAPGPLSRALLVTIGVAVSALFVGRRALRRDTRVMDRVLAIAGVACLVASVLSPRDLPSWQLFSQRFVWIGVILAIVSLPVELVASRIVAPVTFALAMAWTLASYPFHARLAAGCRDVIDGLSAPVKRHGIWLPVTLEPNGTPFVSRTQAEVPFLAPLSHIGALYATAEGGLTPYTFASNPASWSFTLRPDAPAPPPVPRAEEVAAAMSTGAFQNDGAFRHAEENLLASFGMAYEGVLLTGARPDDLALWHHRGYVTDWEQGSVLIAHFEPCALDVSVPGGAAPLLDLGVGPRTLVHDAPIAPREGDDSRLHFAVGQAPCGRVWVRPHWDSAAADGRKQMTFCKNASATGEITATVTHAGGVFACEE